MRALVAVTVLGAGLSVGLPAGPVGAFPTPVEAAWIEGGDCDGVVEIAEYASIAETVAAAQAGDVVHVCPGHHRESEIVVTVDDLTIVGEGRARDVILDGELTEGNPATRHRILDAREQSISLRNLTLQNGADAQYGGAITGYDITIEDSVLRDNVAPGGGAVFASIEGFDPGHTPAPSVTIVDSQFIDNGVGSAVTGGAVYAMGGNVSAIGSAFAGNQALEGDPAVIGDGVGGAVLAESFESYGSTFTENEALCFGGAVLSSSVLVDRSARRVASTFSGNSVAAVGCVGDARGGAIFGSGILLRNSSFVGNSALSGGAVTLVPPGDPGAIAWHPDVTPDTLVVEASTFDSNGASGAAFSGGGAIRNSSFGGTLSSTNSTYVGNTGSVLGGAIWSDGPAELSFNTFVGNSAGALSANYFVGNAFPVRSVYNIYSFTPVFLDCFGVPVEDIGSLTTADSCPGAEVTADALALGSLRDNGGPTDTIALAVRSVAVDAATDPSYCTATSRDQRGRRRPPGACDVGAYEFVASPAPTLTPVVSSVSPSSGTARTIVTITGANLTGASVTIGGKSCAITANTDTLVTCIAPEGDLGPATVVVSTSQGTATAIGAFTYVESPASRPSEPLRVRVATVTADGAVRLRWDAPASDGGSPVLRYVVFVRRVSEREWRRDSSVTERRATVEGLAPGKYWFKVRAVNEVGRGPAGRTAERVLVPA